MRVFIHACDNIYGGLHGMYTYRVLNVESLDEANDYGREMSCDVIQSYGSIMELLEDEIDPDIEGDSAEWEEELNNLIEQDMAWEVYLIDEEKARDMSNDELEEAFSGDEDEFIENYCKDFEF